MLVKIGDTDITEHINPKSYKVNAEADFTSWKDGNFNEHRLYKPEKVKGSFTVALYGKNGMTTSDFFTLWNSVVAHNVATLTVFVQNMNEEREIDCYFKFTGTFHREMLNGDYCDIMTIEISER